MDKIFKFLYILMDIDTDPSEEGINKPSELEEFWKRYQDDFDLWLAIGTITTMNGKARFDWEGITVIPIEHYDMDSAAIYGRSEAFQQGLSNLNTISVILSDEAEGVYVPRHPLARVRREA
jgi:hypothetical protein